MDTCKFVRTALLPTYFSEEHSSTHITHCILLFWSHVFAVDFYSPGETFSFFIEFRTYDCNGILLYTASQTTMDFAALELKAGSVSCILPETRIHKLLWICCLCIFILPLPFFCEYTASVFIQQWRSSANLGDIHPKLPGTAMWWLVACGYRHQNGTRSYPYHWWLHACFWKFIQFKLLFRRHPGSSVCSRSSKSVLNQEIYKKL